MIPSVAALVPRHTAERHHANPFSRLRADTPQPIRAALPAKLHCWADALPAGVGGGGQMEIVISFFVGFYDGYGRDCLVSYCRAPATLHLLRQADPLTAQHNTGFG